MSRRAPTVVLAGLAALVTSGLTACGSVDGSAHAVAPAGSTAAPAAPPTSGPTPTPVAPPRTAPPPVAAPSPPAGPRRVEQRRL